MPTKIWFILVLLMVPWGVLSGCGDGDNAPGNDAGNTTDADDSGDTGDTIDANNTNNTTLQIPDWTEATHGSAVDPDFEVVFPQETVQRISITIAPEQWAILQQDLATNLAGGHPAADWEPVFVPCTVRYGDRDWYQVGIRVKGNSSLTSAYGMGIGKYSFKLDFDEFEDTWPQITNQRFYGFKQLNLNNGFDDKSVIRERVAAELFRGFGLVVSNTATAAVTVDTGDGPRYYGVYTLVEEVDDTVIETRFTPDGNLYKPDGRAASFAAGTFNEAEMVKKNNEDLADYSDVRAVYDALHALSRTTDPVAWRSGLEAVFDVPVFLKWLAANTVMQNWDSYGISTHNFYLYHNPTTGLITWIPWDHNEAFTDGKAQGVLSLGMDEVDPSWPLIRYLLDDAVYRAVYEENMRVFATEVFTPEIMTARYTALSALVRADAMAETPPLTFMRSPSDFDAAIDQLRTQVQTRHDLVLQYLGL